MKRGRSSDKKTKEAELQLDHNKVSKADLKIKLKNLNINKDEEDQDERLSMENNTNLDWKTGRTFTKRRKLGDTEYTIAGARFIKVIGGRIDHEIEARDMIDQS